VQQAQSRLVGGKSFVLGGAGAGVADEGTDGHGGFGGGGAATGMYGGAGGGYSGGGTGVGAGGGGCFIREDGEDVTHLTATRGHGAVIIRLVEVKQDQRLWDRSGKGQERWKHAISRIKLMNNIAHFAQEASAARIEHEEMQEAADQLWRQEVEKELLLAQKPWWYRAVRTFIIEITWLVWFCIDCLCSCSDRFRARRLRRLAKDSAVYAEGEGGEESPEDAARRASIAAPWARGLEFTATADGGVQRHLSAEERTERILELNLAELDYFKVLEEAVSGYTGVSPSSPANRSVPAGSPVSVQRAQSDNSLVAVNKRAAAVDEFLSMDKEERENLMRLEPETRDDYLYRYDTAKRAQLLADAEKEKQKELKRVMMEQEGHMELIATRMREQEEAAREERRREADLIVMALTQWAQGRIADMVGSGEIVPGRDRNNVVLLWVRAVREAIKEMRLGVGGEDGPSINDGAVLGVAVVMVQNYMQANNGTLDRIASKVVCPAEVRAQLLQFLNQPPKVPRPSDNPSQAGSFNSSASARQVAAASKQAHGSQGALLHSPSGPSFMEPGQSLGLFPQTLNPSTPKDTHHDELLECCICLEELPLKSMEVCVFYVCGHFICRGCFKTMMRTPVPSSEQGHTCPMCRTPILQTAGVWVAHTDPKGKTYFYNTTTGEWSWQRPAESEGHWKKVEEKAGAKGYYLNKLTGEKVDELPAGFDGSPV
jgi:hypothetical protein